MSASVMPTSPASASKGFSSTPLKYNTDRNLNISRRLGLLSGSDVLSEDDTYSLLSPIYHDSFDSDSDGESEDLDSEAQHPQRTETSPTQTHSELPRRARSPLRCELPKAQGAGKTVEDAASPRLNAWEVWLLDKAKKDRLQIEKKTEEVRASAAGGNRTTGERAAVEETCGGGEDPRMAEHQERAGEAGEGPKAEGRGGKDGGGEGKTQGDRTEGSGQIQRVAPEEEPRKTGEGKEGQRGGCQERGDGARAPTDSRAALPTVAGGVQRQTQSQSQLQVTVSAKKSL